MARSQEWMALKAEILDDLADICKSWDLRDGVDEDLWQGVTNEIRDELHRRAIRAQPMDRYGGDDR